jgi:hypothetical protein
MEDRYQMIRDGQMVAEEVHRRSPAVRSYTQSQARAVFERAGFNPIELWGADMFDPVKADDTGFYGSWAQRWGIPGCSDAHGNYRRAGKSGYAAAETIAMGRIRQTLLEHTVLSSESTNGLVTPQVATQRAVPYGHYGYGV